MLLGLVLAPVLLVLAALATFAQRRFLTFFVLTGSLATALLAFGVGGLAGLSFAAAFLVGLTVWQTIGETLAALSDARRSARRRARPRARERADEPARMRRAA